MILRAGARFRLSTAGGSLICRQFGAFLGNMTYEEFVIQASLEAAKQVAGPALAVQSAMQLADELVAQGILLPRRAK
jgi:hypothetical protein